MGFGLKLWNFCNLELGTGEYMIFPLGSLRQFTRKLSARKFIIELLKIYPRLAISVTSSELCDSRSKSIPLAEISGTLAQNLKTQKSKEIVKKGCFSKRNSTLPHSRPILVTLAQNLKTQKSTEIVKKKLAFLWKIRFYHTLAYIFETFAQIPRSRKCTKFL